MKINYQMELNQMKESQELKGVPQINEKSKKMLEKKVGNPHSSNSTTGDVHSRLYE
jgi:hypothetical protein